MNLYKIKKIFDRKTGTPTDEPKMCGRYAWSCIFSKEAEQLYRTEKYDEIGKMPHDKVWVVQEKLNPRINSPVLFISVKLGAGIWRTSPIREIMVHNETGDVELTTDNSVYLCSIGTEDL